MKSGQRPNLRDAMEDIDNTVTYLLDKSDYLPEKIDIDKIDLGDTRQ